ncbi:YciY family protein [Pseudomonas aeruginosa]
MEAVFTRRVVAMKRSRTEVGRWRMLRQVNRRKARWLEAQSRRNMPDPCYQEGTGETAASCSAVCLPRHC